MSSAESADGSAVIFLASDKRAAEYAAERDIPLESLPRIKGWGHRSAPISYERKVRASEGLPYVFPQVKRAVDDARARAGVSDIAELDAVETHDCFTTTEYMAIEHLGLTAPGEAWKAVEDGSIEIGGRLPINPSGGLIGVGHPVGATGARLVLTSLKELQRRKARRALVTLCVGGGQGAALWLERT